TLRLIFSPGSGLESSDWLVVLAPAFQPSAPVQIIFQVLSCDPMKTTVLSQIFVKCKATLICILSNQNFVVSDSLRFIGEVSHLSKKGVMRGSFLYPQ